MSQSKVVHCMRESYDVYIGRGKDPATGELPAVPWGNSYSHKQVPGTKWVNSRDEAIAKFRADLWFRLKFQPGAMEQVAALHGKTLGCWCHPKACHGDVLVKAAAWAYSQLNTEVEDAS